MATRKPLLMRGRHGIGKSELVYQIANVVAQWTMPDTPDYIYPVVERRASQMADAGDIMGLPALEADFTTFKEMEWFYKACSQAVILFFDEIDRASMDVRQALFELTDSRKIAGKTLHPNTIIIAAVNSGPHDDNTYQVGTFDVAELDRWVTFDVEPSVEDWLDHAKKSNIDEIIVDFITGSPAELEHRKEFEDNKVYPSRRSWFRLDDALKQTDWLENPTLQNNKGETIPRFELIYLCEAYLGEEVTTRFTDYVKNYSRQVTLEDILVKGKTDTLAKLEVNDHMVLIEKFKESELSEKQWEEPMLENFARWMFAAPAEIVILLWETCTARNGENGIALHVAEVDGREVGTYLMELAGGEQLPT